MRLTTRPTTLTALTAAAYGLVALLMGVVAFGYRLLAHRGLPNDQYMHLAWAQQVLMGDLPGRDFVEPGMPLMYAMSALVQHSWPGPFAEAVLSCVLLGVAAAATCLAVSLLTRSIPWAIAATLLEVALQPRLYAYPKLLAPAVAMALLAYYVRAPSARRLIALGAWTSLAALLRYDLGVYVAGGLLAALLIQPWQTRWQTVRLFVVSGALVIAPWLITIQALEGLPRHLRETIEFTKGETHQLDFAWPAPSFDGGTVVSADNAVVVFFYLSYLLPAAAGVVLWLRRRQIARGEAAAIAGGAVMLALYLVLILRHPLEVRIRDMAALLAIMTAIVASDAVTAARRASRAGAGLSRPLGTARLVAAAGALAIMSVAAWTLGPVREQLGNTRLLDSTEKAAESLGLLRVAGTTWPWERYWPAGPLPAVVQYIDRCTAPTDRILLTWSAPEYYVFSRRGFGAGHALLLPPASFSDIRDQDLMVSRLQQHPVSLVLINESRRGEMAETYPRLDQYLRRTYRTAGHFVIRDGSDISLAVMNGATIRDTYGADAWPCGIDNPPPAE